MEPLSPKCVPLIPEKVCTSCSGTGYRIDDKSRVAKECGCLITKRVKVSDALPKRWHDKTLWDLETREMKRSQAKDFKEAVSICQKYTDQFSRKTKKGLLLQGPVGCGKSHIAAGITKEIILKGFSAVYWNFAVLALEMRSGENGQSEKTVLSKCRESDLVVLDDLGTEKASEFSARITYQIIETRMDIQRPTIVTTNISEHELPIRFPDMGARLASRFSEHLVPICFGDLPDHRRVINR